MRILMTTALAALALTACATAPRLAHDGVLPPLGGKAVVVQASQATPAGADAALAKAVEAGVIGRLVAEGADVSGARAPAYLVQVAVGTAPPAVGVSTAAGPLAAQAPWRSAPTGPGGWLRRDPVRTVTLVVLDVATGRPAAWATVRASGADATDLAERLVAVLSPPPAKG